MSERAYYQRNKEVLREKVLREVLRKKARNKYRELSEKEKDIKREY